MNIKRRSFKAMITLGLRNCIYIVLVVSVFAVLHIGVDSVFMDVLIVWIIMLPVRLFIYGCQYMSKSWYILKIDRNHITYRHQSVNVEGSKVELVQIKPLSLWFLKIMQQSGKMQRLYLGYVSQVSQSYIESRLNSSSCQETGNELLYHQTVHLNTHNKLDQEGTTGVVASVSPTLQLSWLEDYVTGDIDGFHFEGVKYSQKTTQNRIILQTHMNGSLGREYFDAITVVDGVLDLRVTGMTLDVLINPQHCEPANVETYLKALVRKMKGNGIHYLALPFTLPDDLTLRPFQQVLVTMLIMVGTILGAFALFYGTISLQLGQFLRFEGSISIHYFTYLIPFFTPILLLFIIAVVDYQFMLTRSISSAWLRKIMPVCALVWILMVMLGVSYVGIIHQGNQLLRTTVPYSWLAFQYIRYGLKQFYFLDVYVLGFGLSMVSWVILMGLF